MQAIRFYSPLINRIKTTTGLLRRIQYASGQLRTRTAAFCTFWSYLQTALVDKIKRLGGVSSVYHTRDVDL